MGSMMSDLKGVQGGINMFLKKAGKEPLNEDELLIELFNEVQYVWPKVGNPPLVTPFSQYVKNIALMNIMQRAQGKERFTMMDNNTWGMILGKMGKLPGQVAQEIIELAKKSNSEFFTGNPQDNYPDELPKFRKEMDDNGWDYGQDDEELFEIAMHERQYLDYKSGVAKKRFNDELTKAKQAISTTTSSTPSTQPKQDTNQQLIDDMLQKNPNAKPVIATTTGKVIWEITINETSMNPPTGTHFKEGDIVCYVMSDYGTNDEVKALYSGKLISIIKRQGDRVKKGDVIAFIA